MLLTVKRLGSTNINLRRLGRGRRFRPSPILVTLARALGRCHDHLDAAGEQPGGGAQGETARAVAGPTKSLLRRRSISPPPPQAASTSAIPESANLFRETRACERSAT